MTSTPHRYEFTATTGLEARNLLDAAKELLDAHMKLVAPSAMYVSADLLENTPVRLTLQLDLGDANQVATLNQALRDEAAIDR